MNITKRQHHDHQDERPFSFLHDKSVATQKHVWPRLRVDGIDRDQFTRANIPLQEHPQYQQAAFTREKSYSSYD